LTNPWRSGRPLLSPRAAGLGLAGGLLAELMLAGAIGIAAGMVAVAGPVPPQDALARGVLGQVLGEHQHRAAARKDPEEQSTQPGGARSHRARFVRPLDTSGPYGCRIWRACRA
jgi:Golgi phosphoprotein 3 (GPP34)